VVTLLRSQIFGGELRSGDRIDLDGVATALGVSRLPVREALIVLEREGLVRTALHRGAFIAPLSRQDVLDHYAIYGALLASGIARAVETLSVHRFAELRDLALSISGARGVEQFGMVMRFYGLLYFAGSSTWRRADLDRLASSIPAWLAVREGVPEAETTRGQHVQELFEALEAGDVGRLKALAQSGAERGGTWVVAHLEASGFWPELAS
jgi:DNA-binding GntR family transcriptional regulator